MRWLGVLSIQLPPLLARSGLTGQRVRSKAGAVHLAVGVPRDADLASGEAGFAISAEQAIKAVATDDIGEPNDFRAGAVPYEYPVAGARNPVGRNRASVRAEPELAMSGC